MKLSTETMRFSSDSIINKDLIAARSDLAIESMKYALAIIN